MASTNFYRAFEDRHRGSRALIKDRLEIYRSFIEPLLRLHPGATALDLGCGRGEWLEFAADLGFVSHGVDLDEGMLQACRELGLSVETRDAVAALTGLPAASRSIVSGFHIAEHLPFPVLQTLVDEALRVLKPAGLLILETPNPENLVVASAHFYLDPTHRHPLPQQLLAFLAEHAGFQRTKIVRLQENPNLAAAPEIALVDVLYGASPDYALVAQKAGPPEDLQRFDPAFATNFGLTLDVLATRHQAGLAQHFGAIESGLAAAHAAAAAARADAALAIGLAEKAQAHGDAMARQVLRAQQQATEAQARTQSAYAQLQAVYASRSWRLGAPLRTATTALRHPGASLRKLIWRSKFLVRGVIRRLARKAGAVPKLSAGLRLVLKRLPALERRLKRMTAPAPTTRLAIPQKLADLTPYARRIHACLEAATATPERV